ncbi:LCP family protein [Streptomyces roseirectus]|uniref:LCP family protein n=1 Tax=Streptomyces roseirectus TaxID=2768066 RepID=A0A7H0IGK4_9ACTN|nr:LCP family protein [Streptomyces roseirectus]QNP71920.1 LCP family protein [Streptomyces roseirectus]
MGKRRADVRLTRRGRVLAWSAGVLCVGVLGVAGAGTWIYQQLNGNITSADVDDKLGGDRPENLSPGSKNIMIVGSDSRDGANAGYGKDLTTMQSDTLLVLHIPADRKWAAVVSFPRDSWVRIPACDKGDGTKSKEHHFKINEAFALGGTSGEVAGAAACSIKTVEENTGLRIDHFMSVDFSGFKGMVDALDGIEVCPKEPIRSPKAKLNLPAGCQTINGETSLGYVRARYGIGNNSDIGRIGRQQEFMDALAKKAKSKLGSPDAMYGFLNSATKSLTTDPDMAGIKPLYSLASQLQDIPSDRLAFLTVPNYPREADVPTDRANVAWQYPQAADLFTALAKDQETSKGALEAKTKNLVYASSVRVRVLNGTGVSGRAADVAAKLRENGFTVVATGNASSNVSTTSVRYPQGVDDTGARALATRLGGKVTPTASAEVSAGTVELVVGPDLKLDDIR